MAKGAMGNVLGSANTMSGGADYKEEANQNRARQRRDALGQATEGSFRLPGAQQMQAQQQAQQTQRYQGQPMTFANMQKQGVARPAPPQLPRAGQTQQPGFRERMEATAQRMRQRANQTQAAQFQPGGQMPAPTVDRVQRALNQPVQFDDQQRQLIEQQLAARMQINQAQQLGMQTATVDGQVQFAPQERPLLSEPAQTVPPPQPQSIRAPAQPIGTPIVKPQYSVRDRILMSLGRDPVDAVGQQQGMDNAQNAAAAEYAQAQTSVEPPPAATETATRVATPQPVLTQQAPAQAPATPSTPSAPQTPAAQPTTVDRVRQAVGGRGRAERPGKGEPAPQPQAQPQAPAAQPEQPAPQPQQPQATSQQDLQDVLRQQLMGMVEAPSAYQSEDIQQMREAQRADIEAEFSAQRQALEEDLARRGLSASSIAAGRFGDLAGQQARAMATAEAGLTEKAAESLQRGRETAIQGLAQAAGINLEERGLDLQSKKVQADIDSEAKRLMQQDRSLDLQQARDQATASIQRAQLAEQARQRVSNENLTIAKMNQQERQFAQTFGLDERRLQSDIENRAEQIRLQEKGIDNTAAHNMAMQEIQQKEIDQRAFEFAKQHDLDLDRFDSDQQYRNIVIESMLAEYAMPEAQAEIPEYGYNGRFGSGAGRGPNDQGFE